MNNDNQLPPSNIFTNPSIYRPPKLRRERRSDYGMFDDLFEEDVYNWLKYINNQKRRDIIRHIEYMIQTTPVEDYIYTPHNDLIEPNGLLSPITDSLPIHISLPNNVTTLRGPTYVPTCQEIHRKCLLCTNAICTCNNVD